MVCMKDTRTNRITGTQQRIAGSKNGDGFATNRGTFMYRAADVMDY
jgi:hypothetical protein